MGTLKTQFEFELFGTGADAGQTTFRLRHAYGELGQFGAGQTWSPFMDIDVFPNSVEYWGPNGMVFFRNVQFRWMPMNGDSRITIAVERPGASADQGIYQDRIELQDVSPHFPMPDISGEARLGRKWGYVEAAGILRRIEWEDTARIRYDLSGGVWGWGLNFSSNLKLVQKRYDQTPAGLRRRNSELYERRAGRCRDQNPIRANRQPRSRAKHCRCWDRGVL